MNEKLTLKGTENGIKKHLLSQAYITLATDGETQKNKTKPTASKSKRYWVLFTNTGIKYFGY